MNSNILLKCIEELKKDAPDLSYLRGMLETLSELEGANQIRDWPKPDNSSMDMNVGNYVSMPKTSYLALAKTVSADSDEGRAVEAALASLGGVKPNLSSLTLESNTVLN